MSDFKSHVSPFPERPLTDIETKFVRKRYLRLLWFWLAALVTLFFLTFDMVYGGLKNSEWYPVYLGLGMMIYGGYLIFRILQVRADLQPGKVQTVGGLVDGRWVSNMRTMFLQVRGIKFGWSGKYSIPLFKAKKSPSTFYPAPTLHSR